MILVDWNFLPFLVNNTCVLYLACLEEERLQNEITRDQYFTGLVINFDKKFCRIVSYF
ncbi:unnamed protein product [Moneuplotes crassus]|uniref:Uncharacterized protein n=1 Tax=Euplotes crassus TaxID=5936 RepID=A0AAD1U3P1_EUPCR|nr:unnamed protein product [Moneuplotes crassus]